MAEKKYTTEEVLQILANSPLQITLFAEGLTAEQLKTPPGPGEWSVIDVLAHLRSCDDVWGDAMRTIVTQDHPTIKAVSPRTFVNQTDYHQQAFQPSIEIFTRQRTKLLDFLEALTPKQWSRTATVTAVGRPLEKSVLDYADRLARHEKQHVKQIKTLADTLRD